MSLILSGTDGLSDVDGSASTPAIRGTDTNTGIFFPAADTIAFAEGGAEVARFDSSGNLGLGTTSPSQKLTVSNGAIVAGNSGVVLIGRNSSSFPNPGAGYFQIKTNNEDGENGGITFDTLKTGTLTERMRIDSGGNLLVGTTTSNGDGITLRPRSSGSNTTSAINFNRGSTAATGYPIVFQNGGSDVGYIQMSNTTVSLVNLSDYRLKENVTPMTGALAKVSALKPVTYTWKADGSNGQGFIAHELQEVVPDCVSGGKDAVETYTDENGVEQTRPKYQGIDQSRLVATLTAAIQEQQAIITDLKSRIEALEAK
jgi:Chaperone of endosialidase